MPLPEGVLETERYEHIARAARLYAIRVYHFLPAFSDEEVVQDLKVVVGRTIPNVELDMLMHILESPSIVKRLWLLNIGDANTMAELNKALEDSA